MQVHIDTGTAYFVVVSLLLMLYNRQYEWPEEP